MRTFSVIDKMQIYIMRLFKKERSNGVFDKV